MMIERRRLIKKEPFNAAVLFFCLALVWVLFFMVSVAFSAPRGSGSYTTEGIGPNSEHLYLVITKEEAGYLTDTSTNSVNKNAVIISSAISRIELQASNTNYMELSGSTQTKQGGLNVQGTLGFNVLQGNATSYIQNSNSLQSSSVFYVSSASVDGQTILARTSGNVGIGTANPLNPLEMWNSMFPQIVITPNVNNSTASIMFVGGSGLSTENAEIGYDGNGNHLFFKTGSALSNATKKMVITRDDGNVGIGTTNPTNKFSISGGSMAFTDAGARLIYSEAASCGKITILAAGGNLLVSSQPATTGSGYVTVNSSVLNATQAKSVLLKMQCHIPANLTTTQVGGVLRQTGSGIADNGNNRYCQAGPSDASLDRNEFNTTWVLLDTDKDFDYICKLTGTTGAVCNIFMDGYCE